MRKITQTARFIVIGHGLERQYATYDTHTGQTVGRPFPSNADATADAQARNLQGARHDR